MAETVDEVATPYTDSSAPDVDCGQRQKQTETSFTPHDSTGRHSNTASTTYTSSEKDYVSRLVPPEKKTVEKFDLHINIMTSFIIYWFPFIIIIIIIINY